MVKRGLGKGLDALLGTATATSIETVAGDKLRNLPVDLIKQSRYQPRKTMKPEALQELADSIRQQGVVQPILVRPIKGTDKFELIAGERRWRATQMAGLHEIPAVIRDVPDQAAACIALIENIQREDLNPLEEAQTLSRLLREFKMTHEAIAESVGRSRSAVTNLLRLLELHPEVQKLVQNGSLEMGHARAIVSLPREQQPEIARRVVSNGLSVRETERLVSNTQKSGHTKKSSSKKPDPNIRRLQDDLSGKLGAKVTIKQSGKGRGTLEIQYNSLDELDGILKRIK